jgi:hypothetical protein
LSPLTAGLRAERVVPGAAQRRVSPHITQVTANRRTSATQAQRNAVTLAAWLCYAGTFGVFRSLAP